MNFCLGEKVFLIKYVCRLVDECIAVEQFFGR